MKARLPEIGFLTCAIVINGPTRISTLKSSVAINRVPILNTQVLEPVFLPDRLHADNYLRFLNDALLDILMDLPLAIRRGMWFQQGGSAAYWATERRRWMDELVET
ncbi:hypothetical protein ILUMI_18433 [Ignelater luminosus]|uniref:Uncharacterized protein n=1 Tax=Ignelater luminosus TaxID=2038154 RepID=A0A8K0CI17_IGNLU|nr:hypothetical protein ILUMI_18433 [Ignelater luminosus]